MRLIHWCNFPSATAISGMLNSVKEMVECELEMGFDAGICDASSIAEKDGGKELPLRRQTIKTKPWDWAHERDDCVSIISTGLHEDFHKLPHTISIIHGMPWYCMFVECYQGTSAMGTAMNLPFMTDLTVAWSKLEAEHWSAFTPEKVHHIERGVDLDFWTPEGPKWEHRRFHPQVTFLEVQRPVKWPVTFLFAVKYAKERQGMENMRVQLGSVEQKQQIPWMILITKLGLDRVIADYIVGVHMEPWKYYRSSDMLVSPCHQGLLSRTGVEALACGCPTIMLEGQKDKYASLKCRDNPLSMADAMEKVWGKVQDDTEKERGRARRIAEKHYDIKNTVKKFVKLADTLV